MPDGPALRILAIDGGGSWALIPVRALQKIYGSDASGHEILKNFDYLAANSGGSLVAAGLLADMRLSEILALFRHEPSRRRVFDSLPWYRRLNPLQWFVQGPRWSTEGKLRGLNTLLPETVRKKRLAEVGLKTLNGREVRVCLIAFDYQRQRARFLRNWKSTAASFKVAGHAPDGITLLEAVHASTNAPIQYFDRPAKAGERLYWDGALGGYNNPLLAAVVELIANDGLDAARRTTALSLGTGTVMLPIEGPDVRYEHHELVLKPQEPGLVEDLKKAATTILQDPPDAHSFIAHLVLGGVLPSSQEQLPVSSPVVRLNPLIQGRLGQDASGKPIWRLPEGLSAEEFKRLVDMDMDAVAADEVSLIDKLCDLWLRDAINNQPVRASAGLECEIGDPLFSHGVARWKSMTQ